MVGYIDTTKYHENDIVVVLAEFSVPYDTNSKRMVSSAKTSRTSVFLPIFLDFYLFISVDRNYSVITDRNP